MPCVGSLDFAISRVEGCTQFSNTSYPDAGCSMFSSLVYYDHPTGCSGTTGGSLGLSGFTCSPLSIRFANGIVTWTITYP